MGEEEWVSRSGEDRDFKEYENKVERFLAALNEAIEELHDGGHLDGEGRSKLSQVVRSF